MKSLRRLTDEDAKNLASIILTDEKGLPELDEVQVEVHPWDNAGYVDGDCHCVVEISYRCWYRQLVFRDSGDIELTDDDGKPEPVPNGEKVVAYLIKHNYRIIKPQQGK